MADSNPELNVMFDLKNDIIIDEEAFDKATEELEGIVEDLRALKTDVYEMLQTLKAGFDTPAGRKFYNACFYHIVSPIVAQMMVIEQIVGNLKTAKNGYQSVFEEYKSLIDSMTD